MHNEAKLETFSYLWRMASVEETVLWLETAPCSPACCTHNIKIKTFLCVMTADHWQSFSLCAVVPRFTCRWPCPSGWTRSSLCFQTWDPSIPAKIWGKEVKYETFTNCGLRSMHFLECMTEICADFNSVWFRDKPKRHQITTRRRKNVYVVFKYLSWRLLKKGTTLFPSWSVNILFKTMLPFFSSSVFPFWETTIGLGSKVVLSRYAWLLPMVRNGKI